MAVVWEVSATVGSEPDIVLTFSSRSGPVCPPSQKARARSSSPAFEAALIVSYTSKCIFEKEEGSMKNVNLTQQ